VDYHEVIKHGKGATQLYPSVKISRTACCLLVQNGDPSKEIVAIGLTYFAIQTRLQEISQMEEYNNLTNVEIRI
jgi:DNA-damage-inducible protein D